MKTSLRVTLTFCSIITINNKNFVNQNESQKTQAGIAGISLFKSKTNSTPGASSKTILAEGSGTSASTSFSTTETQTLLQAPQTALPTQYSHTSGGSFTSTETNQCPEDTGVEEAFSTGIDDQEDGTPKTNGFGVASTKHQIAANVVDVSTSTSLQRNDANKTPGPTRHPTIAQPLPRESSGNTALLGSQFPPAVTPSTMQKPTAVETPFRGTLSQFDTSLVSPDHNQNSTKKKENCSSESLRSSGNPACTELITENISEESFSQIFLSIKKEQLSFDDGNSAYNDRMLELSSVLCFEHGNMLGFAATCSEHTEEIEVVSDMLDNAIASLGDS